MNEISTPEDRPLSVTGLITNNGELCGYRLSNDCFVSCEDGAKMADSGLLTGILTPRPGFGTKQE